MSKALSLLHNLGIGEQEAHPLRLPSPAASRSLTRGSARSGVDPRSTNTKRGERLQGIRVSKSRLLMVSGCCWLPALVVAVAVFGRDRTYVGRPKSGATTVRYVECTAVVMPSGQSCHAEWEGSRWFHQTSTRRSPI